MSSKLQSPELNYLVHDKEFLAIFDAFKEWRHYLEGINVLVKVFCDHRSLEYFLTTKQLTRRQARWSEKMADLHFVIGYRPGKLAALPDALSRRPDYRPSDTDSTNLSFELNGHNYRPLLERHHFLRVIELVSVGGARQDQLREYLSSGPDSRFGKPNATNRIRSSSLRITSSVTEDD